MRRRYQLAIAAGLLLAGVAWIKPPIGAQDVRFTAPSGAQLDTFAAMSAGKRLPSYHYDLY